MKIFRILLTAAIVLGMTACNNEDPVDLTGQPESTVSVRVVPGSDGPTVRSIGNLTGDGILTPGLAVESAIKQLEVYIFQGQLPDGYKSVTGSNVTQVLDIATHAGVRTIIVVANANIGTVANKAELLAETKDLPVGDITTVGLPMTSNETSVELVAGKNQYGFIVDGPGYDGATGVTHHSNGNPLKLYRVNARVAIVGATLALEGDDAVLFNNLRDVQVAMFNVPKTSKLFGAPLSLAMNDKYLYGAAWTSPSGTYVSAASPATPSAEVNTNFLEGTVTFPVVIGTAPYFYVTESATAIANQQMFIVLRGKTYLDNDAVVANGYFTDADGYTYYPVWVNADKPGYTYTGNDTKDSMIRRNTQYNITLTIKHKGNPNIDPPVAAQLDVNVSVEPWLVVTQGVVW